MKQGLKKIVCWNKYRPELKIKAKNSSLDDNIDPIFRNTKRLSVQLFKVVKNEIKDFNVLIDNKPFFEKIVKNKQEVYKNLVELSGNDDYTIGNLLD